MERTPIVRHPTRQVRVGHVVIGGGAPIVVQSMTNTDTAEIDTTVAQVRALAEAGRLVAPSGRLLVVDFAPHRHDFLRAAAHRRLGFTHDQLRDWFDQVGFDCSTIVDVDPPAGDDGLTVTVWLALNRRTIKKIA